MLTYALIALGGAIGSIARAWLGTAVASLTGAAFPWGTLLINVLGSATIGFFATLTATDGRFSVAADWRAFVMIGLCGGFTTFSSFSLQSWELLRDGRPAQALGNIALSVLLCLGAVAVGYAGAQAVRGARLARLAPPEPGSLGNRIVVTLHRPESAARQLDAAALLLAGTGGGQITALAIDAPAMAGFMPTEEVMTRQRRQELQSRRADWSGSLRRSFDDWQRAHAGDTLSARWIEVRGDAAATIAEHAHAAHMLLLERQDDPGNATRIHAALRRTDRPVLLMPPQGGLPFGRTIAIAWQNDPRARHALASAAPLLAHAQELVLIRLGPDHPEPPPLPLPPRLVDAPSSDDEPAGAQLLRLAREAGADLLVMGGYAHGRVREAVFGGATAIVLATADMPVLMQH